MFRSLLGSSGHDEDKAHDTEMGDGNGEREKERGGDGEAGDGEKRGGNEGEPVRCVECVEPTNQICVNCEDILCEVCFRMLHRKGNRAKHSLVDVSAAGSTEAERGAQGENDRNGEMSQGIPRSPNPLSSSQFAERAKFIPIRLTLPERKRLRLLESALQCISYTDKIDTSTLANNAVHRARAAMQEIVQVAAGLVTAKDYGEGQNTISDKNFKLHEAFFCDLFEIGRRHKIMNPEKMRSEYGKLMYLLQDTASPEVQQMLDLQCIRPVLTVYNYLKHFKALKVLYDPRCEMATMEIKSQGRNRRDIEYDIRNKENAREYLARKYETRDISEEAIKWCLYSIGDNNTYLHFNRDPVDAMIGFLRTYFEPESFEEGYSLAICGGQDGARLTHNHSKQFHYVMQSLQLWREIAHDMYKFWYMAEQDLLDSSNAYELVDTGQGLQRVQSSPRVLREIQKVLVRTQARVGSWVGSSVIHLGDKNVPNALMFIDKYTQVQRILNPIVLTLNRIDKWKDDEYISKLVDDSFGGKEKLKKDILVDFFRYAFDGSGADNFYDAGSCIDGRLTSAWNWCNKLPSK
eukprot:CAMPEP_0119120864 /NCGR_PEP_ID=MMETSP1310-20130426/1728_1 /TAXON_ID=464262 /ORGANISM="Genus nov. species nov., Strain RCC2339" /LENGTH=575 /DNA_ID=CAMNT_0007110371 /DNA_START=42 /DNA_END=1766 /DNA_ORIENTATION=-